jgi:hypothetical protein
MPVFGDGTKSRAKVYINVIHLAIVIEVLCRLFDCSRRFDIDFQFDSFINFQPLLPRLAVNVEGRGYSKGRRLDEVPG